MSEAPDRYQREPQRAIRSKAAKGSGPYNPGCSLSAALGAPDATGTAGQMMMMIHVWRPKLHQMHQESHAVAPCGIALCAMRCLHRQIPSVQVGDPCAGAPNSHGTAQHMALIFLTAAASSNHRPALHTDTEGRQDSRVARAVQCRPTQSIMAAKGICMTQYSMQPQRSAHACQGTVNQTHTVKQLLLTYIQQTHWRCCNIATRPQNHVLPNAHKTGH